MSVSDVVCGFFFFKQKTAYEMRISDWSSDVCSSDLNGIQSWDIKDMEENAVLTLTARKHLENALVNALRIAPYQATEILDRHDNFHELDYLASPLHGTKALICEAHGTKTATAHLFRSEEHTSELQSLMRISYAVFCLKKKKNTKS